MKKHITGIIQIVLTVFFFGLGLLALAFFFGCAAVKPKVVPIETQVELVEPSEPSIVSAASTNSGGHAITLGWDPSPSPGIVGYKLYWGASSHLYTNSLNADTNLSATVYGVLVGTNYYFAATAYDTDGIESDYSVEAIGRVVPPTNVVTFAVTILTSPTPDGAYNILKFLNAFSVTNPVDANFARALMSVSITNIAK